MTDQPDAAETTADGALGEAITQLQGAMRRLNGDSTSLGEATAKLQASTRELSETQAEISRRTAETATQLRDRDSRRGSPAETPAPSPVAGD